MKLRGAFTTVVLLASLMATGCGGSDPEEALRARIQAAVAAAESRDTGFFRDLIGPEFADQRGHDRQTLINLIRGQFIINQRVQVISSIQEISLLGDDAAETVISAGLVGRSGQALALGGIRADLYRIRLEWVHDGDEWRVIGAQWSRAGEP